MKLFIVHVEGCGDVSYWTTEIAAQQEVARLREQANSDDEDIVGYYDVELN